MSEFEDKLNSILSSPEDMQKILGLARSLSGGDSNDDPPKNRKQEDDSSSFFGDFDPKIMGLVMKLMGEYSSDKNDKSALLSALKPYLRKERRESIDKAAKIAKLAKVAKLAFSEFSGGDNNA